MFHLNMADIRLWVRLGCTAEERARPQMVGLDVVIHFASEPAACLSDDLKDTVCYQRVVDVMKQALEAQEFALIEHMAHVAHEALRREIRTTSIQAVQISVCKVSPPVPDIHGGVTFTLERLWQEKQ